jgi:outer membrane receptor for ferrienterochelin and colicin
VLKVHKQSAKQTEYYAEKSVLNTATPTTWLLHRKRKKKNNTGQNNTYLVGQNHNRYLIALKKMTLTCTKAVELKGQPIYHPPISLS